MAAPKLSPEVKQNILQLYSEMSNAELARRFGVSISTISRVIKEGKEQALIQPKKSVRQLDLIPRTKEELPSPQAEANPPSLGAQELQDLEEMEPIEELGSLEAVVGDDFEDDIDLGEEEDVLEDEEPIEEVTTPAVLTILPFAELGIPEMCYIVIDKACEMVTRPLKDFRELGMLPPHQENCRTLPIFNNHRLAHRFSNPHQRIIKMPGHLLAPTQEKLRQKGISYILFNHRVYSL